MLEKEPQTHKIGIFNPTNSDGCTFLSWIYSKFTNKKLPFRNCCILHDRDYWYGGTSKQRKESDDRLRRCVYAHHDDSKSNRLFYFILSWVMWIVVRIGGSPYLPTPWKWLFSNPYTKQPLDGD